MHYISPVGIVDLLLCGMAVGAAITIIVFKLVK
jgi:hypothetical protein